MTEKKSPKNEVWQHIFRLILPHRKKFLWVVTLGLLSTGASLVEPLIYRVAINDVAGLFVRQARENAQKDLGLDPDEDASIRSMIENETTDTLPPPKPETAARHAAAAKHKKRSVVRGPEPHTQGHVAAKISLPGARYPALGCRLALRDQPRRHPALAYRGEYEYAPILSDRTTFYTKYLRPRAQSPPQFLRETLQRSYRQADRSIRRSNGDRQRVLTTDPSRTDQPVGHRSDHVLAERRPYLRGA